MARKVMLSEGYGTGGNAFEVAEIRKGGASQLIQTGWEFPSLARSFGWRPRPGKGGCTHRGTDCTVTCPDCGRTVSEFISAAYDFLADHCGKIILADLGEV